MRFARSLVEMLWNRYRKTRIGPASSGHFVRGYGGLNSLAGADLFDSDLEEVKRGPTEALFYKLT